MKDLANNSNYWFFILCASLLLLLVQAFSNAPVDWLTVLVLVASSAMAIWNIERIAIRDEKEK